MSSPQRPSPIPDPFPFWMVVLVGLFGLNNAFVVNVGTHRPWGVEWAALRGMLVAVMFAEIGVLAVWLVFSRWPLSLRLVLHWLAAWFLFGCYALGDAATWGRWNVSVDDFYIQELLETAATLPAISLIVQMPLWLCRSCFGWQLRRTTGRDLRGTKEQWTIRDLLLGTTIVAVSLACLRVFLPVFGSDWSGLGLVGLCILASSSLGLLPLVAVVLRPATGARAAALTSLFFVCFVLAIFCPFVMSVGIPITTNTDAFLVVSLFIVSAFGTAAIPLCLARWAGYRLRFSGDARREVQRG